MNIFKVIWPIALSILMFSGCNNTPTESVDTKVIEKIIAIEVHTTYSALKNKANTVPDIDVKPNTSKHDRSKCPTGGYITHGDGHKTRCPDCDPPYLSSDAPPKVEQKPEVKKEVKPSKEVQRKYFYDQKTRRWYYYDE